MEKNDKWILLLTFLLGWLVAEMPSATSIQQTTISSKPGVQATQWQEPWAVAANPSSDMAK